MSLIVHAARIGPTRYADEFNVTRATGEGDGLAFAPSYDLLNPALEHRDLLRRCLVDNQPVMVSLDHAAWRLYRQGFLYEMRESYRVQRTARERLLARESVTLLCYCVDPERCHRTLLAREILPRLGAVSAGERPTVAATLPTLRGVR